MANRVLLIRHGDDPRDDRVYTWLQANGFSPDLRKPFAGEALPETLDDHHGVVVYGGKYSVTEMDAHPFLRDEDRIIGKALACGKPLLGICQGAQQIAAHLSAGVGPKPGAAFEFGYYEVRPVEGGEDFMAEPVHFSQAHFHGFGIPAGAVRLAESDAFENQAFRHGDNVFGVQFHPEVTKAGFRRWQDAPWAYFAEPGAQDRDTQDRLMAIHDDAQEKWFHLFLGRLFGQGVHGGEAAR